MKIEITEEQRERAAKRYDFGELKNSVTKGKGNIYGALGEIITIDYLKQFGEVIEESESFKDYDIEFHKHRIDVKTRKISNGNIPNKYWNVGTFSDKQDCDYYVFCHVQEDMTVGFIDGFLTKEEFFAEALHTLAGHKDGSCTYKAEAWNVKLYNLKQFKTKK